MAKEGSAEDTIKTIKRKTQRKCSAEEKIRTVLEGLRGEDSIAALAVERVLPRVSITSGALHIQWGLACYHLVQIHHSSGEWLKRPHNQQRYIVERLGMGAVRLNSIEN